MEPARTNSDTGGPDPAPPQRRGLPVLLGAAALILLAALGGGCGQKKPPVPPPQYRPPAPSDVQFSVDGDRLQLSWQVPGAAEKGAPLEGCRVYRAARNIGEDACPGCPVPFITVADLRLESVDQRRQSFRETLQPGFLYAYKVACYTARGNMGQESQPVYAQSERKVPAP